MQNLKLIDYTKKRLDDMYVMMYTIKNDLNVKKGDIIYQLDTKGKIDKIKSKKDPSIKLKVAVLVNK